MTLLKRHLIHLFAWLTLILFVGIIGLWVSSYQRESTWNLWSHGKVGQNCVRTHAFSSSGILTILHWWWDSSVDPVQLGDIYAWPNSPAKWFPPYGWDRRTGGTYGHTFLEIPYWALSVVTFIPAAASVRYLIRRNRLSKHRNVCPTCGYDLRASPERCPECGTVRSLL